jgi:hypothetical protein
MKCIYQGQPHTVIGGPYRAFSNGQLVDYVLLREDGIPVIAKKSKITFVDDGPGKFLTESQPIG